MRLSLDGRAAYGKAIVARFKQWPSKDARVKADLAAFTKQQAALAAAQKSVDAADAAYEKALAAIGAADRKRDGLVDTLADACPSEGVGTRQNPFAALSAHAPGDLKMLPYAKETTAIRELLPKLPANAALKAIAAELEAANEATAKAIDALTGPEAASNEARASRNNLLPDWDKALRNLKESAKPAYRATPGRYDALFSPADAVQAPTKKRGKKKAKPPVDGSTPGAGAAQVAVVKKKRRRRR